MHPIIIVFVLPPSESFSILVSLESLYGICETIFFLEFYERVVIQFPNAKSDLLMLAPSCIFFEQLSDWIFSEPAKSIMNNFAPIFSCVFAFYIYTWSWRIAWDLDEYWLACVDAKALLLVPLII